MISSSMATARKQQIQEEDEERLRKFTDQRFIRKSPAKPYDRPPTRNNSWILKLVDPAQRLISSGSRMLSSSAFRRLASRESSQSRRDDEKGDGTVPFEFRVENQNKSEQFEMMELEETLKQKTFTRSEIDHLTTLLHSRNVDLPVVNEEKKFEVMSSIPKSIRKEFVAVPNSEVKMGRQSISTPILSSSVLDENISSPSEIAREYMHSRQRKFCPSIQSLRAKGLGEISAGPTSQSFSSKSTDLFLVPSTTCQGLKRQNSFSYGHIGSILPPRRIRQKRNIHLSKRLSLPISPRPISVPVDGLSFDASQSSKFAKVLNLQLPLKPRTIFARKSIINVESNNIPSAGSSSIYTPSSYHEMASKILEQLTPPKNKVSTLSRLPVGEKFPLKPSPFTIGEHLGNVMDMDLPSEEFVHDDKRSNSLHRIPYHDNQDDTFQNKEKPENMKPLDPNHRCALMKDSVSIGCSKDSMNNLGEHLRNEKDVDLPSEEFVPDEKQSNSLHRIQYHDNQDDTFQNKEKPESMKPLDPHHRCALLKDSVSIGCSKDSMNNLGEHLRNVKNVDSPNEELLHGEKESNSLNRIPCHDNQNDTVQNKEKPENMKPLDPHRRCALLKDSVSIGCSKDSMNDLEVPASAVVKSTIHPPINKSAFQMVLDKDGVDHDEGSADRIVPATQEVIEGDNSLALRQTTASEALAPAKSQTTFEVIADSPLNKSSDSKSFDDRIDGSMVTRFTLQDASSLATTSQPETMDSALTNSFGNKDLPENKRNDSPGFSFENNISPRKQPYTSSTTFFDENKDASLTETHSAPKNGNGAPYPYTQCNPASFSDIKESVYLNANSSSNHKLDRSWGTCNDVFSSSASISTGLAFSFRTSACTQSPNNGPSISCPSLFSSNNPSIAATSQSSSRNIFLSATTGNHPSTTNLAPSSAPSTTGLGTYEDTIKQDVSLNKENDTYFTSITTPENSNYSMSSFGTAATLSSMNDQLSTPTVSNATELGAREVSDRKEFIANAERTSMLLGSSMMNASSAMAGKSSISSGISFGCSSSASERFNLGTMPSEFTINGLTSDRATSTIGTSYDSTSSARLGFESSTTAPFSSKCRTTSAAAALTGSSSKAVLSNSHPKVATRVSSGNNQCEAQCNVPLFRQKRRVPSGFSFGPAASVLNPFLVKKQQTYSSLEAKARGSFTSSVGDGDGDKAIRRLVKVRRKNQQKHYWQS